MMKRNGFTIIEMMIALTISAFMLTAILGTLSGVWLLVKNSYSEMQLALHSRYVRERLFYSLSDQSGKSLGYGLIGCTNITFRAPSVFEAFQPDGDVADWYVDFANDKQYLIDTSMDSTSDYEYRNNRIGIPKLYQYVYLKLEEGKLGKPGYMEYHDRLVIPIFGAYIDDADVAKEEFVFAIGGKHR